MTKQLSERARKWLGEFYLGKGERSPEPYIAAVEQRFCEFAQPYIPPPNSAHSRALAWWRGPLDQVAIGSLNAMGRVGRPFLGNHGPLALAPNGKRLPLIAETMECYYAIDDTSAIYKSARNLKSKSELFAKTSDAWIERLAEEAEAANAVAAEPESSPLADELDDVLEAELVAALHDREAVWRSEWRANRVVLEAALTQRRVAWSKAAQQIEDTFGGLFIPLHESALLLGPFACLQAQASWPLAQLAKRPMVLVACEDDYTFWLNGDGKIYADNNVDGIFHPAGDTFADFLTLRVLDASPKEATEKKGAKEETAKRNKRQKT